MFNISRSIRSIDLPQIDTPKIDVPSIDLPDVNLDKAMEPLASVIARIGDEIRGRRNPSPDPTAIIGGMALGAIAGAIAMYFLDPDAGRRRRALVRDQLMKLGRTGGRQLEATTEQIGDRSQGIVAEAQSIAERETVDDPTLEERVRTELGRITTESTAVQISARNGQVLVEGWLPEGEADRILDAIRSVPGVQGVIDRRSVPQTQ